MTVDITDVPVEDWWIEPGCLKFHDFGCGATFVALDRGEDALVPSKLARHIQAKPGARIKLKVIRGPRGIMAIGVLAVDRSTETAPEAGPVRNVPEYLDDAWRPAIVSTVFRSRGYGFVTLLDGDGKQAFFHFNCCRHAGLRRPERGDRVSVRVGPGANGSLAVGEIQPDWSNQ